jgi:aspartate kinase
VIVMKFGGTSVADAERILGVAEIVRRRFRERPVVVVSALAGITDALVRAVEIAGGGDREALEPIVADVERRHRWALAGSVEDPRRRHDLSLEVDRLFEDLRQRLRSVRILGEVTPRAADAVLAFGERLASRIVAAAFRDRGLDARHVDAREVVRTDDRFGAAQPDFAASSAAALEHLGPALEGGEIPVLGGFIGATASGETTTLGRGGSDTSAAVLGMVLGAAEIQIWTDVDGLMSADPRRVPAARRLDRVSFAEAVELAFYGARVLHPDCLAPALRRDIPVRVLNSLRPEAAGTLVLGEGAGELQTSRAAVASREGMSLVRVRSRSLRRDPEFVARVLGECLRCGGGPDLVAASGLAVSLALPAGTPIDALAAALGERAEVERLDDRAIVCIVGEGLATDAALRRRVLAELANREPEMVAVGVSRTSVAAVIAGARLPGALVELHRRFFEEVGA